MKSLRTAIGIATWLAFLLAGCAAMTPSNVDVGKQEFEAKCANCHGVSGKGDGPLARHSPSDTPQPLKPANLTLLAKQNGGVFPAEHVYEIIDGRVEVTAHGPRLMPVWGKVFQSEEPAFPTDQSQQIFAIRESRVQAKIQALVDYISRLQDMK